MESVRTNIELTSADDELRAAKEKDIAMIASAKDIFKSMEETNAGVHSPQLQRQTVKLVRYCFESLSNKILDFGN